MIREVISTSQYLTVSTQHPVPYLNMYSNTNPGVGTTRFTSAGMEIYDSNNCWVPIETISYIQFTPQATEIFDWVKKKMDEEQQLNKRCEQYPALKQARDNFILIDQLTREGENLEKA